MYRLCNYTGLRTDANFATKWVQTILFLKRQASNVTSAFATAHNV